MKQKIIFISGVHGVGKTTLCKELADSLGILYVSASELIKKVNNDAFYKGKLVPRILDNQTILLDELAKIEQRVPILLDGHFALFNSKFEVETIASETFQSIQPSAICILTGSLDLVVQRVAERDGIRPNESSYQALIDEELAHGERIANELKVPMYVHDTNKNTHELQKFVELQLR